VFSAWNKGGYRDIRSVDVASRRVRNVTRDRALDHQPTWSADGRFIYFTSDRTGIANVYAFDSTSEELHQVTNVINGAYMPEVTPDGRTLFYVGYTHQGFDLFSMPLDRSRFLTALPYKDDRPGRHPEPASHRYPVSHYNPLSTLRPRAYELEYGPSAFGQALRITTLGADIAGHHAFSATALVDTEEGEPTGSIAYAYRRLPFDFRMSVFRSAAPRLGYRYGDTTPVFTEHLTGISTGISYGTPGEFDGQVVSLNYTSAEFDSTLPVDTVADPYSLVTRDPHRGFLGILTFGFAYSNADSSVYGVSAERGFSLGASLDVASPQTGSDETLTAISARATGYIPMPWLAHHTLALAGSAGASVGTYPRRGLYFTGGFVDLEASQLLDAFETGIHQGSFVLRGYAPAQFIGTHFNLLNAEYRFPILYADRGVGTLPVFLRGVSGAVFADYGGAFNQVDLDDPFAEYHMGVGGELWFDIILGYFARGNVRVGYARGLDDEAISGGQTYLVVSSAF
jgi:dipeptidyl aminopeptidase/acylaminoacyl peptidase